jgi:hypothetical protein
MSRKVQCAAQASGLPALSMSSGVRVARANLGHGLAGVLFEIYVRRLVAQRR